MVLEFSVNTLTDIFTQISDSSGHMIWNKFDEYLRELLALPTAIFEGPSFGYTESASRSCFDVVGVIFLSVIAILKLVLYRDRSKAL